MGDPRVGVVAGPAPASPRAATRRCHYVIDSDGVVIEQATRADVTERIADGRFFWLDLGGLGGEEIHWLRDIFHFHPLAIEDAIEYGQRPKIEEYDDFTFLVLYGSGCNFRSDVFGDPNAVDPQPLERPTAPDLIETFADTAEVHFFVGERFLVTVHGTDCRAFSELHRRLRSRGKGPQRPTRLVYLVADTLVDSFFPVLNALDDRIDDLEDQVMNNPSTEHLAELLEYKRGLIGLRKVVAPQRDIFATLASGVAELPSIDVESRRYLRDVYDHLIRLTDSLDSYRDLLAGTMDAYLSVTSNQLNVIMKQLAIISTVFLPLSFLTGFFGQNFGWMVNNIGGWETFFGAGIGIQILVVVGLVALFKRRRWL